MENLTGLTDGNGNETAYATDLWGRVETVTLADGTMEHYSYDHAGNVCAATDGNGNTVRCVYNRANQLAERHDAAGSITHVLSEDAEILNHYSYDAFGNIIEKTEKVENRFCYNGEMLDPVTQQYYLRARFYNPVIGRFTQEDTYYGDGLNLYQYCQANPVGYVDPSGHNICSTQLSLYKKYKEFFAKKMPEDEAKKKAYEYMRKKMGLTADNPFTEASEGGTKSAYNDRGNTVKNWKGQNAAGAYQSATEKGNSKTSYGKSMEIIQCNTKDAAADELAKRIGGQSRSAFADDPIQREFDVISDQYIAQAKPPLKCVNKTVRTQMKATFEAAKKYERKIYYQFEGIPSQEVLDKLYEYSERYGVEVIIDTEPLGILN